MGAKQEGGVLKLPIKKDIIIPQRRPLVGIFTAFSSSKPLPRGRVMQCRSGRWPPLFPSYQPPLLLSLYIASCFLVLWPLAACITTVYTTLLVYSKQIGGMVPNHHNIIHHTPHTRQAGVRSSSGSRAPIFYLRLGALDPLPPPFLASFAIWSNL